MTTTYVLIGLLVAAGGAAWFLRGRLASLGQKVQEEQRARLKAEAEARMREEWSATDARTAQKLDNARHANGRGNRLRSLLSDASNRETPDASETDVPTPDNRSGGSGSGE